MRLFDSEQSAQTIDRMRQICAKYQGNCTTFVTVETAAGISRKYRLPESYKVDPCDDLVRDFDQLFGTNRLLFTR